MSGIATSSKPCYNCGVSGHDIRACDKPKADCDVCGPGIGHTNEFCLAQCRRDIPASISEPVKQKILARRAQFFAAKNETSAATLPTIADEDELRAWLDQQDAGAPADAACHAWRDRQPADAACHACD
eukprot:7386501-Prymnesium_polylepis.1